jgi:hypothetical protein
MTKCNGNGCLNPVKYSIIYDCGESSDQELSLCDEHYVSNPVFQKYILKIVEIEK